SCTHPWLRVTCGVCGDAVDALGESSPEPFRAGEVRLRAPDQSDDREHAQATFIVARGHPELIDQLRALMGHGSGVKVIEDRRQHSREEASPEQVRELRKRLREDGDVG
ncbi:MAG: hypothetical protein ACREJR_11545, partial [Candidatus Rokuibacteriota bacterium]